MYLRIADLLNHLNFVWPTLISVSVKEVNFCVKMLSTCPCWNNVQGHNQRKPNERCSYCYLEKIPLLSCHKSGDFCFSIITKEFVKITVTTFLILFTLIVTLNIIVD